MSSIYLVRHGETEYNKEGRLQGQLDASLNETGIAQARRLAAFFQTRSVAGIVTSPLQRAARTAAIIAGDACTVWEDPAFAARRLGDLEGVQISALKIERSEDYRGIREEFAYCPPGGGESAQMVLDRALPRLHHWADYFGNDDGIIVTHAVVVKVLLYHLIGCAYGKVPVKNSNSSVHCLDYEDGSLRYCESLEINEGALRAAYE